MFPTFGRKMLLFYDLIPLQHNERYSLLNSYNNYLARYKIVFEADLILTISQTVADDVALNLGISQSKIFNINGAPIESTIKASKKPNIRLPDRYILMPSGDEIRKNNIRATQGFEAYRRGEDISDIALVVTSHFTKNTMSLLKAYSKNIIFTGNVPEEELSWLYKNAEALLFVPEYEGLGLPILEASGYNLPIVCSDLTVFNEISQTAFYYSDPFDPPTIAEALKQAFRKIGLDKKLKEYPNILRRYTWENSAELALKAMKEGVPTTKKIKKIKLAILTPTPSGYSAIGKLIMQLHPAMNDYFDIDYYVEEGKTKKDFSRPNYLPFISKVSSTPDFDRSAYGKYDYVIYHIGNSEFHMDTIKNALYLPGYAIFHDTYLTDVFEGALMAFSYINQDRLNAEMLLDKKIGNNKASYISSIVNNQLALIAHSDYSKNALDDSKLEQDVTTLKLNLPTVVPKQALKKKKGNQITIGLAGIIHPAKGLDVIEKIAQTESFYDCKIHIFGLPLVPDEVIKKLQSYPNVQVDTNVTDFQFQNMLSQVDVLINYRLEYRGETSLATIEAMRFGIVPIVKKIGWYDELPDNAVVKVLNSEQLINELKVLIDNPSKLAEMKLLAKKYIEENHSYQSYAKNLYEYLENRSNNGKINKVADAIKTGASLKYIERLLAQEE